MQDRSQRLVYSNLFVCSKLSWILNFVIPGSASFCLVCGHGGHSLHMARWFAEENLCPTGCGCNCLLENSSVLSVWIWKLRLPQLSHDTWTLPSMELCTFEVCVNINNNYLPWSTAKILLPSFLTSCKCIRYSMNNVCYLYYVRL